METEEITKTTQNSPITLPPKFILVEKHIKFGDPISNNGCQRIHHCSCDCNYIKCSVFFG